MKEPLARFIALYQQLDKQQLHRLPEVYAEQVIFIDPAHRIDGLPAPRCWADLLQPALRGRVQMADPRTSGTAYTFLTTQLQMRQGRGAWPWLQMFHQQVGAYTRSGSAPIQAVRKGEALVGVDVAQATGLQVGSVVTIEQVASDSLTGTSTSSGPSCIRQVNSISTVNSVA